MLLRLPTVLFLLEGNEPDVEAQQALDLAHGLDGSRLRVLVAALGGRGAAFDRLRAAGAIAMHTTAGTGRWDLRAPFKLASLLRKERVDILQTLSADALVPGLLGAKLARTPVRVASVSSEAAMSGCGWLRGWLLRSAAAVIADSERTARRVISAGVESVRLSVVYHGLPAEAARTSLEERQDVRSRYGVLDESWLIGTAAKTADDGCFLQAASIVRAEVPGTKFMLLGNGLSAGALLRRAAILGLDGSIILAAEAPNSAAYYGAMDLAVVNGGEASFGLQAMGLGRPIVAADVGANSELFPMGEAGLVIPSDNPLILAHSILELMRQPEAVERIRKSGREIFEERFTMKRMVSGYEELYLDLWSRYGPRHATSRAESADSQPS